MTPEQIAEEAERLRAECKKLGDALAEAHERANYWTEQAAGYSLRAAAAERELAEAQADSERFEWWFSSDVDKWNFMTTYFQGIRERWPLSQWRAAIDAERGRR